MKWLQFLILWLLPIRRKFTSQNYLNVVELNRLWASFLLLFFGKRNQITFLFLAKLFLIQIYSNICKETSIPGRTLQTDVPHLSWEGKVYSDQGYDIRKYGINFFFIELLSKLSEPIIKKVKYFSNAYDRLIIFNITKLYSYFKFTYSEVF